MEENSNKDTEKLVLSIINNGLATDLTEVAIDRTHHIGDPKKKRKKVCPIIVKLVRYYDRKDVFSKKIHLKEKVISITENLTSFRMNKYEGAREKFGQVSAIDGPIMFKYGNDKPSVYYG